MNSQNFYRILLIVALAGAHALYAISAKGLPTDQAAADMLTDSSHGFENENNDSVIRWGIPHNQKVAPKLDPISEDAFGVAEQPATAGVSASRSPASEQVKAAEAAERKLAAKTIVRNLAKRKAYQEVAVIVNDLGFFPSTLFVTQGIPVRLFVTGASKKSQCFMMDAYGIRRQIQSQKVEEITFTPDETGSFAFSCPMNGAKGSILVKELELDRVPANLSVSINKAREEEEERAEEETRAEEARKLEERLSKTRQLH